MSLLVVLLVLASHPGSGPESRPPPPHRAQEADIAPETRLLFHLGGRGLDDDDFWEPVENAGVLGFEFVRNFMRDSQAGVGLELGFFMAGDSDDSLGVDVSSLFLEASVGLRARLDAGPVELSAGAGPTFLIAAVDIENGPEEDDTSPGFYVHAGALVELNEDFGVGLDARVVRGTDVEFDGFADTDADYGQLTLVFAWTP